MTVSILYGTLDINLIFITFDAYYITTEENYDRAQKAIFKNRKARAEVIINQRIL